MKKIVLILLFLPSLAFTQQFPSYPRVVTQFLTHYTYTPAEPTDALTFAKKKDGWHVQLIDRMTDKPKSDQLFWSLQTATFLPLTDMDDPLPPEHLDSAINSFLQGGDSFRFYAYERCRYYGYGQWSEDMIKDFGPGNKNTYSDTLLEGLARAYSAYASKFLWYQYGGEQDNTDLLKSKLAPLQKPSKQRIDSVNYYYGKSIETYKLLAQKNNKYMMTVGNVAMKVFNEQMNGYMQMSMAGYDSEARRYIQSITPNPTIEIIARNYLGGCAPNAILFTSGDNDTYTLWYLQQASNFRKDVAVVNLNLLGLPAYIDMLKRKGIVNFTTAPKVYGDSSFLYSAKQEGHQPGKSLSEFIKLVQNKTYPVETDFYGPIPTYSQDEVILNVDLARFKKIAAQPNFHSRVKFPLDNYLFISDFIVLDIVNSNLYNRPIYFTFNYEAFAGSLQMNGLINQFLPLDPAKDDMPVSFAKTRAYLKKIYKATPSNDFSTGVVPDYTIDGSAYSLYVDIAQAYLAKKKPDSAAYIIDQLFKAYNNNLPFTLNQYHVAATLLEAGRMQDGYKLLMDYFENLYQLYRKPSTNQPYVSRESILQRSILIREILVAKKLDTARLDEITSMVNKDAY